MTTRLLRSAFSFAALLLATTFSAWAESTKIGTLECFIDSGSGFVVGSSKDVSCTLFANDDVALENFIGEIKKWGVDIGFTEEAFMQWAVYVPQGKSYAPGSLGGQYTGASASASFAVGLGASILLGGSEREIALEPVALRKQEGINIAVGIARLELRQIEEN